MSEYTPTTDEIREYVAYGDWGTKEYPVEEFDRWLAKHDAEVERAAAEKAWNEGHGAPCDEWVVDEMCREYHLNPYRPERNAR